MPTPNASEQDILLVHNPDIDCNETDSTEGWSHKEFFQVKWGGQPHRVKPGETRRMPRFLAEHYAKHLADHILIKEGDTSGRKGLMQSPVERPKVLSKIILGVEEYFGGEMIIGEAEKVIKQVEVLNEEKEEKALDLGIIPNSTMGTLIPEPPSLNEVMNNAGIDNPQSEISPEAEIKSDEPSIYNPKKRKPTKKELLETAYHQGINVTGNETEEELIKKIRQF